MYEKPEQVKAVLRLEIERRGLSYGKLAKLLDVSKGFLYRFINDPDYIPRDLELKRKVGLDPGTEIIVQTVKRDPKGRWARDE